MSSFAFASSIRGIILAALALICSPLLHAQCAQQPNECCPPESADSLFSEALSAASSFLSQVFCLNPQNPAEAEGPLATSMNHPGTTGLGFASSCRPDPAVALQDAGRGSAIVSSYGVEEHRVPLLPTGTSLQGLANLYPSVLVFDVSRPSWNGESVHLKSLVTGDELPVPYVGWDHLEGEEYGLQPRPGNMPGQYIFEHDGDFYHYGGPLETGASPQTTAVYEMPNGFAPPTYLTNQLSGAQLWLFLSTTPPSIEVRHVDGSVAQFETFQVYRNGWVPSGPPQRLWRLKTVRDPYDNVATYAYNNKNQLTSITFPSGITQTWRWSGNGTAQSPSWPNWPSTYDLLEISYTWNGTSPPEVAGRTWGLAFESNGRPYGGRHFGGRLLRTYSAVRQILVDAPASGPYTITPASEVTAQIVGEFSYGTSQRTEAQSFHQIQNGTSPFDFQLASAAGLSSQLILNTTYGTDGRVTSQARLMTAETLTFTYPSSTRTTDLLAEDVTKMRAIVATKASGTSRRQEFSYKSGRIYSMVTTPSTDFAGRPRATHVATENSSIGGVAATDVEPEWIEIYNVFDATCVCQKPIRREERSRRGGQTSVRTWEFEYHPVSKLVTRRKAPNPQAGSGPFAPTIEWVTTYAQLTGTSSWGAWVPSVEATPFGQHIYSYTGLAYRAIAGHGQTANTTTRSLTNVSLQTTLAGPAVTSGSPVVETIVRNLSSLTGSLPWMGPVQGQPRQMIDGDGVVRTLEYSASGYLTAEILGTDIRTTYTPDAVGNVTSTTAHVTSASPAVTSLTRMPGVGAVITATCNSAGVLRESRAYYDRFGHLAVARQNNLDSIGNKPSRHGVASGSARDWVEEQFHYHHTRLMETYVDRKPLDEAAGGGALFLATAYDYALDGRLVHWSPWRRKRERCCRFSQAASVVTCCRSRPRWRFWQLSGSRAADSGARSNLFWLRIVGMFAT